MAVKYNRITEAIVIILFTAQFTDSSSESDYFPLGFHVHHFTRIPENTRAVNLSDVTYDPVTEKDRQRGIYLYELDLNYEANVVIQSQNAQEIKVTREEESSSPGKEIEGCLMCMIKKSIKPTKFVNKSFGKSYNLKFYLRKNCLESECNAIFHHEENCCQIVVNRICDYWMRRVKGWRVHVPLDSVTKRVYENNHDLIQYYCNSRLHEKSISVCWKKAHADIRPWIRRIKAKKMCPRYTLPNCDSIAPLVSNL